MRARAATPWRRRSSGSACTGSSSSSTARSSPSSADWRQADALEGKAVNVSGADGVASGMARGIDLHGALLLETPQGVQRFIAGDVTVRPS